MDDAVEVINLDLLGWSKSWLRAITNNIRRFWIVRKEIIKQKPDVVLSMITETNILSVLSTVGLNVPLVLADHADPRVFPENKLWHVLRNALYPLADSIVLLDRYFVSLYTERIRKKCLVIPNPVRACDSLGEKSYSLENEKSYIIAVGRFIPEKRFDVLLEAFSLVNNKYPNIALVILGDGGERKKIEALKTSLRLDNSVFMSGLVNNTNYYLRGAELFVLTSDSEGFPMVLCEAMSCGLPVVSTEYHMGANDLITEGENGFVVAKADIAAIAEKIIFFIENEKAKLEAGAWAKDSVACYAIESVDKQWKALFDRLVHDE
jgi:glycosyltransferase involved in cell wall biosynthesis